MADGKVNPKGAKQRSAETKAQVLRVLEKFTPEIRAAVEACLAKDDHFGLFRLLEDLIVARQIDDLMRRDQEFRKYLASIYAARYPRLDLEDVGRAIEEEGAEMDWRREQQNKPPKPTEEEHQAYLHREIQRLQVLKAKEDELGIELIPREKPMFIPIPLAPREGGPAPREPFPSDWTFRVPANDKPFMYDPRKTCESFLPPLYPPGQDPRLQPPGPPSSGLDEKTMDILLNRVKDVTRAVNVQEKMKEAAEKGETLPRWSLETLRLDRRWKEKHDPAVLEHEDPPVEVFWQMMLEDLADQGATRETLTLDDARELQGEILAARPSTSTSMPPPKRPWQERYPEYAQQQDGDTIMRNTQLGTPHPESSFYSPHPPNTATAFPSPEATPTRSKGKEKDKEEEKRKRKRKTLPPNIYDENRLFATLENARDAHPEDTAMYEYRGWRIHSPMIQIIRIKNFLADEDLDRTLGWHAHFDEVAAYLKHLWDDVYDGTQRWGPGLKEAICMLKTHDLFETRAYGRQYPNVHFETPVFAPRLRPHNDVPGISVTTDPAPGGHKNVAAAAAKTITPRYLLHRVPESIHDVDYQIPGRLLRTRFLTWFRQDTERVWYSDPMAEGTAGSGSRGHRLEDYGYKPDFNMAEVEDEAYNMCIEGGTNETAAALRGECNFNMERGQFVVDEDGTAWPDGEAARKFAMFRGAKRAALQQCLRHFEGGQVNSALVTPFRKLVMPIPWKEKQRLRAEAQKKISFTPIPLSETPKDVLLDPWAWNHWHDTLVGAQERRARLGFHTAYVRDRRYVVEVEGESPEDRPVLTSKNMNGPYVHSFLPERTDEYRVILKKLMGVYDLLKSTHAKTPRTLLEIIINHVGMGFDAAEMGDPYSVPDLDNAIVVEFERLNAISPPSNPHDPIQAARIPYRDLCWLRHILNTPSTTRRQLEHQVELKEVIRTQPVFMHRLQMLIDNPDPMGFLSALQVRDWHEIPAITEAINNLGNGGDRAESAVFSEELTSFICDLLDEYGILNRQPLPGTERIFYRRAFCNLHPEERINWYAVEPVDEAGHPSGLGAFPPEDNLLSWLNAATANLFDSSNLAGDTGPSNADRLNFAFRLLGFRIGYWIYRTRQVVYAAYEDLETAGLGQGWSSRVEAHLREADKMISGWRHDTTKIGDRPSYGAVVKAADSSLWEAKMTRDAYDDDAVELVRANKIRELTEAINPLWPARQDWRIDEKTGKETMTLSRGQNIWAFGREGARGRSRHPDDPPRCFFNMNRWPLHLQTPERQARTSGGGFSRCDLDIEYSTGANIVAAFDNAMAEVLAEKEGLQRQKEEMQRELEMAHAQLAMRAETETSAEPVPMSINTDVPFLQQQQFQQEWQDPKDLAPPFPEFIDPKWRFVPGRTEFWEGDTRLQRKTFDKQWREVIEGPAEKPRGFWSSIFGRKPPPSPNVQNPEVQFPKYTDPKKSRIPRSYPRAPEEDELFLINHPGRSAATPEQTERMKELLLASEKHKKEEAEKAARKAAEQLHEEELDSEEAWAAGEQLLREAQHEAKRAEEEYLASVREAEAALAEAEVLAKENRKENKKLIEGFGFGMMETAGVAPVPGMAEPAGVIAAPSSESPTGSEMDRERAKVNLGKVGEFTGTTPVTDRGKKFKDSMPPPPRP